MPLPKFFANLSSLRPLANGWTGEDVDISLADHQFASPARDLYVGTAGDVKVVTAGGSTHVFKNVPAGAYLGFMVRTVVKVGTTAGDMVGVIE